jgi:hypothetical protein
VTIGQGLDYHVDLVFVIDTTNSMTPVLERVKSAALGFHALLTDRLERAAKHVDRLRIRVVSFRDLPYHRDHGLAASPFFELPRDEPAFSSYVNGLELMGNDTLPESALAGLSVAIRSDWTKAGSKRRHVIVVWTDDAAHLPEHEVSFVPAAFRDDVASSLDELTDAWEAVQDPNAGNRRLVVFAPEKGIWPELTEQWTNVVYFPSQAGDGLKEVDMDAILDALVSSV